MTEPKISVLMTVFNTYSYLSEAVDSILNQTFKDFEFIIIDDGSTDGSWDILSKYAGHDSRIILQQNSVNLGPARSSNKGLEIAKGNYIARFDSDDISYPHRLQEQLTYMEAHPEVGLITTAVEYINDEGEYLDLYIPPIDPIMVRWQQIFNSPLRHPTAFWRRRLIQDLVGAYNTDFRYSLDYDFFVRAEQNVVIHTLLPALVKMRQRSTSITFSKGSLQDSFACVVTYQQFERYFAEGALTQAEQHQLRALLRRYSPLQQQEFADLDAKSLASALKNYLRLFENFCTIHRQDMDASQVNLLHSEIERHLPALVRHGLRRGWLRLSFKLILDYLSRYPSRIFPTLKTLAAYAGYYSLRSIKPLSNLINSLRSDQLNKWNK